MTGDGTERLADVVGWVTLGFGTALTLALAARELGRTVPAMGTVGA